MNIIEPDNRLTMINTPVSLMDRVNIIIDLTELFLKCNLLLLSISEAGEAPEHTLSYSKRFFCNKIFFIK